VEAFQKTDEERRIEVFLRLRPTERATLFHRLPDEWVLRLLERVDSPSVAAPLQALGLERARSLVSALQPDDAADIVLRLPQDFRTSLLAGLPTEPEVSKLLHYPEGTAGAWMTNRYVSVPEVVTVARALDLVREAARVEAVNYIYVVGSGGQLLGTLSVRNLLMASPRALVREVSTKQIVKLLATAARDQLIQAFQAHRFLALPVVDDRDRLIGVVTFDDVLGLIREREEQLVYSVTGVNPREHLVEGIRAARGRIPWVSVTIIGGLMCAAIGTIFKRTIEEVLVLGLFVPLVLAIGESVSSQTAAIVMKTLMTGAIPRAQIASFLGKELWIGLLVGIYAGFVVGLLILLWRVKTIVALTVGGSIGIAVVWAALLGVAIPYILRRTRVDPSIASGPVVLFLCDLSTLLIYFGGAQLILI
jgi:magnesium transporter